MLDLSNAIVYDIECLPNVFTITAEFLYRDVFATWEISQYKDDRRGLFEFFDWLHYNGIPMIGFNNIHYDYPIIDLLFKHRQSTYVELRAKSDAIIKPKFGEFDNRFAHTVWERDRFAPQIDLMKIHHFDNVAKSTSLKALQFAMRSETIVDSPVDFNATLTSEQINRDLIPYNISDTKRTKDFAHISMNAIKFRLDLIDQFGLDVMNYNDTKIGEEILIKRIGHEICYDTSSGRKVKRQTFRNRIALNDVIFPYIRFEHPEFQRVLDYMRSQVLTPDDITDPEAEVKTKGVFTGLKATIDGFDFCYGTGGIHGSVERQRFVAGNGWRIRDIDVAGLYPNIGIVNSLAPAHLGDAFVTAYASLPAERKEW